MTEIFAYAAMAYLAVQFGVAVVNLITNPVLARASKGVGDEKGISRHISVLIPARNEESNIDQLLEDLVQTGPEIAEILIYDDASTDRTAEIILRKSLLDRRISYIRGNELPSGWLGKNNACHQLALKSTGDYLLFMDADVRIAAGGINDAMNHLEKYNLDLLSLFPVQQMKTSGEWLTVPLMNRILLGNLALFLIRRIKWMGISAANGQFMLFRAGAYKKHWFHEYFKKERVEDIRIIRLMKKLGYRTETLLSNGQVRCRMYRGYRDALNGFSKNVSAFFGNSWLILNLYMILTTLGPFAVWLAFSFKTMLIYLAILVATRLMTSFLSRQNPVLNVLLMPLQQLTLIILTIRALWLELTGRMEWKGRRIL